ncbi:MAG: hypothetical protein ACFWUC_06185 [Oscillospiraceae bacterium]|jgi:hypothetical protein
MKLEGAVSHFLGYGSIFQNNIQMAELFIMMKGVMIAAVFPRGRRKSK